MTKGKSRRSKQEEAEVVCVRTFFTGPDGCPSSIAVTSQDNDIPVADWSRQTSPMVRLAAVKFIAQLGDQLLSVSDTWSLNGMVTVYYRGIVEPLPYRDDEEDA